MYSPEATSKDINHRPGVASSEETISALATSLLDIEMDRQFIPQDALNLANRQRTSRYAWRGQFSPELIDLLLEAYTELGHVVVDPFVGSGTTLFEAVSKGLACYGAEVNPAALMFASMARFATISREARVDICNRAWKLTEEYLGAFLEPNLLSEVHIRKPARDFPSSIREMFGKARDEELLETLLACSLMQAMGDGANIVPDDFLRCYWSNQRLVETLPVSPESCQVWLTDARNLPLSDSSVDFIVTSPPYINVFNYHQNHRRAMELLGWQPLTVARSEIGSNRKHRGNRLLTVVQYCIDMLQVLDEMRRVLRPAGAAVITIGRESNVRKVSFRNAQLLATIALGGAGFELLRWQERVFTSRYGTRVYEDLLTIVPSRTPLTVGADFGRAVGIWALGDAMSRAPRDVTNDLTDALARAEDIQASPLLGAIEELRDP